MNADNVVTKMDNNVVSLYTSNVMRISRDI